MPQPDSSRCCSEKRLQNCCFLLKMRVPQGVWCPDLALGTKQAFLLFSNPFGHAGGGRSATEWFDALCWSDALRDSRRNAGQRGSPGDGGLSALARTQPLAASHAEENPVQLQAQIRSAGLAALEWKCGFCHF